ncbi:hypothetical protein WJ33_22550 [Burkholderia ubonensis]|uniref:Acyltransferase 3 domain-containing protein n=1 Tax=Burkholderia ubonensis TaxID=101571 RepID=A0A118HUL5_9BURK|nr:acyltransferase [Burkholderia ubonensis]KVG69421.1 hypothetical protein WJ33_22550 [Burkholderia ubonensis]
MDNIRSLTALRAVAASTVVYFHIMSPTGNAFGEFAVDIFFVISGFVIAMVVNTGTQSPSFFLASRIVRIAPLYWFLTLLVFVIAIVRPNLLNSPSGGLPDLVMSLFFIPYKKPSGLVHPLLFVGWTLNYEMFFYVIASAALLAKNNRTLIISGLVFAIFELCRASADSTTATAFYSSERMLEFVIGMFAWEFFRRGYKVNPIIAAATIIASYSLMAYIEWSHAPFSPIVRNGIPSFIIVVLATSLESWFSNGRLAKLVIFVGDASYATYLSHPYVVEGLRKVFPIIFDGITITSAVGATFTFVFALGAGAALYVFVDKPVHAAAKRSVRRWFPDRKPARPATPMGAVD